MRRLTAMGIVALAVALAIGAWPASASRMSRPDKTRVTYQRDVRGENAYADGVWKIHPRSGGLGIIVGAAVCGDEAFLLDRQFAVVHRVDLARGRIVDDLGVAPSGTQGLRQAAGLVADCAQRTLYVVDGAGVAVIDIESGQIAARYAKPSSFVNSIAATVLDTNEQAVYVPGLWPEAPNDWLVKPVDRMFEGDRVGYRLDLRTGQTSPMVPAVERGCWSLGPNCLFASLDRVGGSAGGWVAAHTHGMLVGVFDSAQRLVRNVDVRSPRFLESGRRNGSKSLTSMVAWNEDNSVIRGVYAFGSSIVTVHSFNRTRGWKPGRPTDFEVFMNLHSLAGTGLASDIRLPDMPVGRDATSLYVVDYGASGRRRIGHGAISLFRIPVDFQ
jgi:hypothetical protein